ncbi:DNA-binding IclR family transcriptional regulator [Bacillus sp. RC252]
MKFLRVSQVSELTGLHPSSLRRMLMEHATIQKDQSFVI